jgi:hypothetical protein
VGLIVAGRCWCQLPSGCRQSVWFHDLRKRVGSGLLIVVVLVLVNLRLASVESASVRRLDPDQ